MHTEGVELKATKLFKLSEIYCIFRNNFHYFWHVAMSEKFASPRVGAPFLWGPCLAEHAEHA